MKIERQDEFSLSEATTAAISRLFILAFDGYPDGLIYYNQIPDFRILAWDGDDLIGHIGIHYRKISIKLVPYSVFGIVDLCVDPMVQLKNVGSKLLDSLNDLANDSNVDFLMLTSEVNDFYIKNGFEVVHNPCRWLVIHKHESLGVFRRELKRGLMIKVIGTHDWPDGEVDLMGHMF